jgi:hypothetical protein
MGTICPASNTRTNLWDGPSPQSPQTHNSPSLVPSQGRGGGNWRRELKGELTGYSEGRPHVRFPVAWKVPAGASPPLGVHGSTGAALNAALPGHCMSRTHFWFPTQLQMKSCVVCAAWGVSDRQTGREIR